MTSRLKASAKLYLLVFVMSIFIIGIGIYGIFEMKIIARGTQTLYADRVLPMQQLARVRTSTFSIVFLARQAAAHHVAFSTAKDKIWDAEQQIAINWDAYMLTYQTPEETQLALKASALINEVTKISESVRVVMDSGKEYVLNEVINNKLYPSINPVLEKVNELIDLQSRVGGEVYQNSLQVYKSAVKKFILLIIVSLAFAIPFAYFLFRNIQAMIKNLQVNNKLIIESEEKYRTFIQYAGDCIFFLDQAYYITDANNSGCSMLGYTKEELKKMKISDVMAVNQQEGFLKTIDRLKKEGASLHERKFRRKDGSIVDTEVNVRTLDGVGYISIIRDITERKKAQHEIIKEKQLSDSIINSLPGVFYLYTTEGKFLRWNKNFEKVTLYNTEEIRKMHPLDFFPDDEKELLTEKIGNVFIAGEDSVQADFLIKTKEKIPYYFTGKTVEYEGVLCLMGVGIDFSELTRAEEEIKQAYEKLHQLTAHLLSVREEERKRIGREIHDELGQQLTAIKMDTVWIDKKIPEDNIVLKAKLKNIITLLNGGNLSIRRILNELRPVILDDYGLVEALKWQGQQFTANTGIPVEFVIPEIKIKIPEEIATCIFRICQETLTNITRYAEASNVLVSLNVVEGIITFIIEDNGKGFDLSAVRHNKSFGILGMKERVLPLNGQFTIDTAPGKGTKINVSIALK